MEFQQQARKDEQTMDMQTLDVDIFLRSLTEEQMDTCESDEKKLEEIFKEGWSEETAVRFHRAMICARRITPDATVEGVFETALRVGLTFLADLGAEKKQNREDDTPAKLRRAAQRDRQLRERQKSENRRKRAGVRGV